MDANQRFHLAALASFENMTTARLHALLIEHPPSEVVEMAAGRQQPSAALRDVMKRSPELADPWRSHAQSPLPEQLADRCTRLGVRIVVSGDPEWPPQLLDDPRRPAVLFFQGRSEALDHRRVGIVGTRNPTHGGAQTAARFGHELAEAGVTVISGLALGIDGAAHRGALAASGDSAAAPVAVVANGHGEPYPRSHGTLWRHVAEQGLIISEWPPGTRPDSFRFPQRNRILAALSELVVVVESRERGGSLITAREASERGIDVYAVPGPLDRRSSAGTNLLLQDGAVPALSSDTLLAGLGLDTRRSGRRRLDSRARPRGDESEVYARCRSGPQSLHTIATALGWDLARAALALARLERSGWVAESGGWFHEVDDYAELA